MFKLISFDLKGFGSSASLVYGKDKFEVCSGPDSFLDVEQADTVIFLEHHTDFFSHVAIYRAAFDLAATWQADKHKVAVLSEGKSCGNPGVMRDMVFAKETTTLGWDTTIEDDRDPGLRTLHSKLRAEGYKVIIFAGRSHGAHDQPRGRKNIDEMLPSGKLLSLYPVCDEIDSKEGQLQRLLSSMENCKSRDEKESGLDKIIALLDTMVGEKDILARPYFFWTAQLLGDNDINKVLLNRLQKHIINGRVNDGESFLVHVLETALKYMHPDTALKVAGTICKLDPEQATERSKHKKTPLAICITNADILKDVGLEFAKEIVALLLDYGASPLQICLGNLSALSLATTLNRSSILGQFKSHLGDRFKSSVVEKQQGEPFSPLAIAIMNFVESKELGKADIILKAFLESAPELFPPDTPDVDQLGNTLQFRLLGAAKKDSGDTFLRLITCLGPTFEIVVRTPFFGESIFSILYDAMQQMPVAQQA